MLEFILGTLFAILNPISLLAIAAVSFAFEMPVRYLGLYVCGVIASVAALSIPNYAGYSFQPSRFDFIGDFMVDSARIILIVGLAISIIVKVKRRINIYENSIDHPSIKYLTYAAWGCLGAYFFYLFCTDFFKGYQAALEVHIIIGVFVLLVFVFGFYSQIKNIFSRYRLFKDAHLFAYSFSFFTSIIIAINSTFALVAYQQTKEIVNRNNPDTVRYCVQTRGRGLNSWLELTPLTIWNKPRDRRGAATRHAVLVVDDFGDLSIYHWSYKLRSWQYTSAKFVPNGEKVPSSLDCTLEKNYFKNLPLLLSPLQVVSLETKQFAIPIRYVPRQYKLSVGNKTISFYALLPKFTNARQIFYRLSPEKILQNMGLTNVQITNKNIEYIDNTWFKPYSNLEIKELKSEYGLQKRTIPQVKTSPLNTREEIRQHVQYYEQKEGIVTTLISCNPDQTTRLNCEHYFFDGELQYNFRHSDRDLKNWRKLQIALVSKVKSWQL